MPVCDLAFGQAHPQSANAGQKANHKEVPMARKQNKEVTSKKAASAAGKVLRNPKSTKAEKTAAASALTQRPNRPKKKGRK